MTYENGKTTADVPVTYMPFSDGTAAFFRDGSLWFTVKQWRPDQTFDDIVRAFRFSELAEDASKIGEKASDLHDASCFSEPCNHLEKAYTDWLRKYEVAKAVKA